MLKHHELAQHALTAAHHAAEYLRSIDAPPDRTSWDLKGTADFVTDVDRTAERMIADALLAKYPDAVVMGEELSPHATDGSLVWIVDPLDGTTNFLHQYPACAVSIAARVDGELAAGVVADVWHNVLYRASAGGGAWCGDQRMQVSSVTEPADSLIGTGFPFKALDLLPRYLRQLGSILRATSGVRRAGSAALDLVDTALGRFEGFWELSLAPWDVAAGTLIVREAGGRVTDLKGSDDVIRQGPIVAGNPTIHAWLLDILAHNGV